MKRLLIFSVLLLGASNATVTERERATHALNRLAFGARPGDVERVLQLGVDRWIEQQLHPERISDRVLEARLAQYDTLTMSNEEIVEQYAKPLLEARRARKSKDDPDEIAKLRRMIPPDRRPRKLIEELSAQRILRAAESERQLNEVMVDFWMNHFNVFAGKGVDRFLLTSYERDTIRPRIWGHFDDLVLATAKAPAMLFYLDNARSRNGAINENYARELMELHTLGVDGGYTQNDVTELARVLTGWSLASPRDATGGFVYRRNAHDRGTKTVLGIRFAAGGGMEEGERMIRFLANHSSTAHHIVTKLCQRLVADDPPKALVDRVAKRFLDTRGDLRETVKAVVTSREFSDPAMIRAKVKSPFEYAISAVRAAGAKIEDPLPLARELQKIGEPLYFAQPPTGYSDRSDAWTNSGALMNRLNFVLALAEGKMPGVRVSAKIDPMVLGSPEFQKQ
ncbi:MAG TPA: DUF1800 domain-containing protein [Thermoanaerobaculia bacterium]|nr:DUF1800 domain-containing protein [Thermoanaerobaculia bacterium]